MKKKKVILVGAYGCGNKGDDAILEGILYSLNDIYDFSVVAGNYGGIEEKFNVKTIQCRMNEGLTIEVIGNLLKFFPKYLLQCFKSDYVLIGGGSLLHDITRYNLLFFSLLQKIAEICGNKVIYIGTGAGPINTNLGKFLCKNVIGKAEKIFVRDIPDYRLLKKIGLKNIELVADMAFTIKTEKKLAKDILNQYGLEKKKYIVVTACEWFKSDNFWNKEKMDFTFQKRKLANLLEMLSNKSEMPIVFLPTVFHDYKLGKELQNLIPDIKMIVLPHTYDCSQMAALVAESWILFGIRMHSIIFAIRAGIPFITSIYDSKVESLIKRCNMEKYVIDFEDVQIENINNLIEDIKNNESIITQNLNKKAEILRKKAQKAIIYMREKDK